ncbi:hypothetical protein F3G14_18585, partial [Acinetobacter baumannii]
MSITDFKTFTDIPHKSAVFFTLRLLKLFIILLELISLNLKISLHLLACLCNNISAAVGDEFREVVVETGMSEK